MNNTLPSGNSVFSQTGALRAPDAGILLRQVESLVNDNLSLLTNRVRTLQERRETLVTSLRRAAADLRTHGRAPAETVRTELEDFNREWESLVAALQAHELGPPADLEEAAARVDEVHRRSRTESALAALAGLDRVCGEEGHQTPAALEIRSAVEIVRAAVTDETSPDEAVIEDLQAGRHPLVKLRMLLEGGETLSDDAWEDAVESVREQFGRPVATAAVRRRLRIASEAESASVSTTGEG